MPLRPASRYLLIAVATCLLAIVPMAATAQEALPEPTLDASPTPAATPAPAEGPEGTWRVVAFDAWGQGLAEPRPDSRLTVSLLDDARLQGETGCGRFNGGWSLEGDELFLGLAPSGFVGCAEQDAEEALGLSTAFDAVRTWQPADAGTVELLDATGATRVTLERFTLGELVGTWDVQRYRRPNGRLIEPLPGNPMALILTADGQVEGNTGCRLLVGTFAYQGGDIVIGPVEAQGRPCEGDVRRAERQLLRALGDAIYWEQNGDTLALSDAFAEALVELVRVAEPPVSSEPEG